MNQQDLSGKIVFKVRLDKEIKKIVIHNDDINYNELLLMMQRIFAEKIKTNDEFTIKYTDEENDLITLSNDSDVLLAIQSSKILKLTIFSKFQGFEWLKGACKKDKDVFYFDSERQGGGRGRAQAGRCGQGITTYSIEY